MSVPAPEFSRVVRLDQAVDNAAGTNITATAEECLALARRFGFVMLDRLDADYVLAEEAGGLIARGQLRAALAQPCVATAEPVAETVDTPFRIRFRRESDMPEDEEFELNEEECDIIFFEGASIDMGEAVAQTLALSIYPYPRAPDADAWLRRMGVLSEGEAGPFAALAALKSSSKN